MSAPTLRITIEGAAGAGKTLWAERIAKLFREAGKTVALIDGHDLADPPQRDVHIITQQTWVPSEERPKAAPGNPKRPSVIRLPNLVLPLQTLSYHNMSRMGTLTMGQTNPSGFRPKTFIEARGFEYDDTLSRRETAIKTMNWARDVLSTAIAADQLVPGGNISIEIGEDDPK